MRENFTKLLEEITMIQMEKLYPLINLFLDDVIPVINENLKEFGAPLTLNVEEVYNKHRETLLLVPLVIAPTEEEKEKLVKRSLTEFLCLVANKSNISISAHTFQFY